MLPPPLPRAAGAGLLAHPEERWGARCALIHLITMLRNR